jgi:serine/threonine-protein kinase HipA
VIQLILTILLTDPGPRLAPFYDLLCKKIYEGLTDKLAMKIGGENRPGWLQEKHWKKFANSVSIKQNHVLKILSDMIQNIVPKAEELAAEFYDNYGTDGIIERICSMIRKRALKIGE